MSLFIPEASRGCNSIVNGGYRTAGNWLRNVAPNCKLLQLHFHFDQDMLAGVNGVIAAIENLTTQVYGQSSSLKLVGESINDIATLPALSSGFTDITNLKAVENTAVSLTNLLKDLKNTQVGAIIIQNPLVGLNPAISRMSCLLANEWKGKGPNIIIHNHDPRFGRYKGVDISKHVPNPELENVFFISNGRDRYLELRDQLQAVGLTIEQDRFKVMPSGIFPQKIINLPDKICELVSSNSWFVNSKLETANIIGDSSETKFLALSPLVKHKNIEGAIRLAHEIAIQNPDRLFRLIVTGMNDVPSLKSEEVHYGNSLIRVLNTLSSNRYQDFKRVFKIENLSVVVLGGINEIFKPALIQDCNALFYLSTPKTYEGGTIQASEGMGMPPIEAAYYGFNPQSPEKSTLCVVSKDLPSPATFSSIEVVVENISGHLENPEEQARLVSSQLFNPAWRSMLSEARYNYVSANHIYGPKFWNSHLSALIKSKV